MAISRRLLLRGSSRRGKKENHCEQGANGLYKRQVSYEHVFLGQEPSMAKKRSLTTNRQNGTSHVSPTASTKTSTKTAKTKSTSSQNPTNITTTTYYKKIWLFVLSSSLLILSVICIEYRHTIGAMLYQDFTHMPNGSEQNTGAPSRNGGWRLADDLTNLLYNSSICSIDRYNVEDISQSHFEKYYRLKKPLIVRFKNGAKYWTDPVKWTVDSLSHEYGDWSILSGNAREIVRRGGSGYVDTSFTKFVKEMIRSNDSLGEPLYVFDREFYKDSSLPKTLHLPSYFDVKDHLDDSIFFLGSSGSGVSFHKHADAWNGVVYGRKRWFLYPAQHTPPGGVYPGYTQTEWFNKVYPHLTGKDKPMECIQEPGEIFYLPESTYHGTINLGDTIAIGIQKKQAQTEVEKLFYEENKLVGKMRSEKNLNKKNKLLQRKKEIYITLLKLLPDNTEVLNRAGQMYRELGDLDKALFYIQRAIKLDKHFIVAVISLGELYDQLGNKAATERQYKQALQMNPRLWDCYARYGDFLLNQNRPAEAVDIYRQGVTLEPEMIPFWNRLKLAQERAGDIDGAKQTQKNIDRLQNR